MNRSRLLVHLFFVATLLLGVKAYAATLIYPGAAPCSTTLQACINGATAGDTIELAIDGQIEEDITLAKSLTLTSAAGFSPSIGSADATNPKTFLIEDSPDPEAIDVILDTVNFTNALVDISFSGNDGSTVLIQHCTLVNTDDFNNTYAVNLNLRVASTIQVLHNTIFSSGTGINVDFSSAADIQVELAGNFISTRDPAFSNSGIAINNNFSGNVSVDVHSNVITGINGCNCGNASGIAVDQAGTGDLAVDIVNNTINDIEQDGYGIYVGSVHSTGPLHLNMYNNIVSNSNFMGIYINADNPLLHIASDYNNFFNNTAGDEWRSYDPGAHSLAVDPLYVDALNVNFALQDVSPLIDAGINSATGVDFPALDFTGGPRTVDGSNDIGAYEKESAPITEDEELDDASEDTDADTSSSASSGGGCSLEPQTQRVGSDLIAPVLTLFAVLMCKRRKKIFSNVL